MSNQLQRVQEDLKARLEATPYFDDIGLFIARPSAAGGLSRVQSTVDKALAGITKRGGKCGVACIVLMPTADAVDPDVPGPRLSYYFTISVLERPLQNMGEGGTLKPAEEVAIAVLQLFHHFKPNNAMTLVAANRAMVPVADDAGAITQYDVSFTQFVGLPKPTKPATPTGSGSASAVTLVSATGGASILYSIDGSYPTLPYTTPVDATGALLRAVAEHASYDQQSDVYQSQF